MMRQSETMRAASRLLLSHPIVCLLAVLAAGVVLGVFGPITVVHATDVATVEAENFDNKPSGGGGSLTYIGSATGKTGTTPQVKVSVPVPPGTKKGDVMLALLQADYGNVGGTLPPGWKLIKEHLEGRDLSLHAYYKIAAATEPSSYTWNVVNTARHDPLAGGTIL